MDVEMDDNLSIYSGTTNEDMDIKSADEWETSSNESIDAPSIQLSIKDKPITR